VPIEPPPRAPTRAHVASVSQAAPVIAHPGARGRRLVRLARAARVGCVAAAASLAVLALAGCKLLDQTTFAPAPAAPSRVAQAPRIDARTPLLTIGPETPVSGYTTLLRFAVQAAERRDGAVRFDVTAVAPAVAQVTPAATQATGVMRAIAAAGVPPDRILLRAVLDPAVPHREVRVYVR
jgi:hypothetical protein